MKSEIKKSLLEATPDLQESKSRLRKAVLQLPKNSTLENLGLFLGA